MKELLIKEKQDLQARYQKTIQEYTRLQTIVMQLEGAILHCDEMLKKIKDDSETDS